MADMRLHIMRANYQTLIWRQSDIAYVDIPSPIGNGWMTDEGGHLIVQWTDGDIMPQQLIDIWQIMNQSFPPYMMT